MSEFLLRHSVTIRQHGECWCRCEAGWRGEVGVRKVGGSLEAKHACE